MRKFIWPIYKGTIDWYRVKYGSGAKIHEKKTNDTTLNRFPRDIIENRSYQRSVKVIDNQLRSLYK